MSPAQSTPDAPTPLALAYYRDAALYEYHHRAYRVDIPYYAQMARDAAGPVLELGAGGGRLTLPMAKEGATLVAVDSCAELLARLDARLARPAARSMAARVSTRLDDFRSLRLDTRFSRVCFPFNTLLHAHTDDDIDRALATAAHHLAPGGRLVFDIANPDLDYLAASGAVREDRRRLRVPGLGEPVWRRTQNLYDAATQINYAYHDYLSFRAKSGPAPLKRVVLMQRQYFPREMDRIVREAGFAILRKDGDFKGGAFTGDARVMVYECERRAAFAVSDKKGNKR